ncbi:MAG: hypothetical protein ACPGRZ_07855 [Alphaproteobacteria bacterium]
MTKFLKALSGVLIVAGILSFPSGMANALTISFAPPLEFGEGLSGSEDTLAIDFDSAVHVQQSFASGTPNSVWVTNGGAISIGAGVEVAATLTIQIGPNATFLPLAAVFEDSTGSLAAEIFLSPGLSTPFASQTYNLNLPFAAQATGYDLYFGLKHTQTIEDSVDITQITLTLDTTEVSTVSAPGMAAVVGLSALFLIAGRRSSRTL